MFMYMQELVKFHLRRLLIFVGVIVIVFIGICTFFTLQASKKANVVNTTEHTVSAVAHKNAQALFNSKDYKGAQATAHQTEYIADNYVKSQMNGKDTAKAADKIINKSIKSSEGIKKGQSIFDNANGQNVVQQAEQQSQQPVQQQQQTGSKFIIN